MEEQEGHPRRADRTCVDMVSSSRTLFSRKPLQPRWRCRAAMHCIRLRRKPCHPFSQNARTINRTPVDHCCAVFEPRRDLHESIEANTARAIGRGHVSLELAKNVERAGLPPAWRCPRRIPFRRCHHTSACRPASTIVRSRIRDCPRDEKVCLTARVAVKRKPINRNLRLNQPLDANENP